MVQPQGIDHAIIKRDAAFADVVKVAVSRHLGHIHRKIRIGHLIFDGSPEAAAAVAGVEEEKAIGILIQWSEEWYALNVIPVKMRKKDMGIQRSVHEFL